MSRQTSHRGDRTVAAVVDDGGDGVLRVIRRGVTAEPARRLLVAMLTRAGLTRNAGGHIGEVGRHRLALLVNDALESRVDEVEARLWLAGFEVDLGRVVARRRGAAAAEHALEDMRGPDGAAVGDAHVGAAHLEGCDEDVALADGDVRVVAAVPLSIRVGPAREVVPLPLRVGNSPGKPHWEDRFPSREPRPRLAEGLLHSVLLVLVEVEQGLRDLRVEDDVTGVGDAVPQVDRPMALMVPTPLTISLAEARPPTIADVARAGVCDTIVKGRERRERLDGGGGYEPTGKRSVHEGIRRLVGGERLPVILRDTAHEQLGLGSWRHLPWR